MEDNNPFAGSEYAEALSVLRTIIQEQTYEDFYHAFKSICLARRSTRQTEEIITSMSFCRLLGIT